MTVEQMWDVLMEQFGVNEQTLRVVTAINGYNEEALQDILYVVAGYRDFDQLEEE